MRQNPAPKMSAARGCEADRCLKLCAPLIDEIKADVCDPVNAHGLVVPVPRGVCYSVCGALCKANRHLRDGLFIMLRMARQLFNHAAVAVAGGEVHLVIDSGGVAAQNLFDAAGLLKEGFP